MPGKFYTNPNESGKFQIVHATKWSRGGRGEYPLRFVVIFFPQGHLHPYAVREQVKDGRSNALFGGSSYMSRQDAHDAFLHKYLRHNQTFKKGNISHIPGIVR